MFPVKYTIHNEQYNGINFINVIFQTVKKQLSVLVIEHCQKVIEKHLLSIHGRRYTFLKNVPSSYLTFI